MSANYIQDSIIITSQLFLDEVAWSKATMCTVDIFSEGYAEGDSC